METALYSVYAFIHLMVREFYTVEESDIATSRDIRTVTPTFQIHESLDRRES